MKKYTLFKTSIICLVVFGLSSCETADPYAEDASLAKPCQSIPGAICFKHPENPAGEAARIYVFRPNFTNMGLSDSPRIHFDKQYEVVLPVLKYSTFNVGLGHHDFTMSSSPGDKYQWNVAGSINIDKPGVYYMAVWNSRIPTGASPKGTKPYYLVNVGPYPTVSYYNPPPPLYKGPYGSKPNIEFISESDALDVLYTCELVQPH